MKGIETLKARDVMRKDVVRLSPSASIDEAVSTLEENEITGAPVVDSAGKVLGVFSTRDVTRAEHVRTGRIEAGRGEWAMTDPMDEDEEGSARAEDVILGKEDYSEELVGSQTVADWMNPRVVTVSPDDSLRVVCRKMTEDHIHRVFVATQGKLEGIITSFDIVRCVAGKA